MSLWLQSICQLLIKYYRVTREAWAIRKKMATPIRRSEEYDFLPAHIELMEKPVSPFPRMVSFFIVCFLVTSLFVSIFFQVEIISVSSGKLSLSGRSKVIQPLETSLVRKIYVKDGELVKKGQLLISLTATGVESDIAKVESALAQARLAEIRQSALIKAIESDGEPSLPETIKIGLDHNGEIHRAKQLLQDQFIAWKTAREQQKSVIQQRKSEREVINSQIKKLSNKVRIEFEKLNDMHILLKKNAISKHDFLAQENSYIDVSNELDAQKNRLKEVSALVLHAQDEYKLLLQNFKRDTFEQLNQTKESIKQLIYEIEKVKERQAASQIISPVDGIVQQLAIFTEGGVVTTAQTLMVIVPQGERLEAKVMISNKDIGFVHPGQRAVIKVEAFPYTRYGYIYGTVTTVSSESIEDKEHGVYFDGVITLDKSALNIYGKDVALTSGMSVSAEIITGYRRVIDFILSPLQQTVSESFRER